MAEYRSMCYIASRHYQAIQKQPRIFYPRFAISYSTLQKRE